MFAARVVGDVVATTKHRDLHAEKLLLVQPVTSTGEPRGKTVLAVDRAQAGPGDWVLVADEGNAASQILQKPRGAIRTVIVGIIDAISE